MTTTPKIGAVNVDVDGLHLYYQIHGISPASGRNLPSVWETGVVRFLDLFRELGIRATFFVVTEDLAERKNRDIAERALREGHELASHSHTHPYDLVKKTSAEIEHELRLSKQALQELGLGTHDIGFRAPGYNTSPQLLDLVAQHGFRYDSSLFPCPPYILAKAAFLLAYRVQRRPSRSIVSDWRSAFGNPHPHRLQTLSGQTLWEFPITVLPAIRFPVIGTSLITMGRPGFRLIQPLLSQLAFVNLEFHAIDMTDPAGDGIDPVLRRQPDQRVPLAEKEQLFRECLRFLTHGWEIRTLMECMD